MDGVERGILRGIEAVVTIRAKMKETMDTVVDIERIMNTEITEEIIVGNTEDIGETTVETTQIRGEIVVEIIQIREGIKEWNVGINGGVIAEIAEIDIADVNGITVEMNTGRVMIEEEMVVMKRVNIVEGTTVMKETMIEMSTEIGMDEEGMIALRMVDMKEKGVVALKEDILDQILGTGEA